MSDWYGLWLFGACCLAELAGLAELTCVWAVGRWATTKVKGQLGR